MPTVAVKICGITRDADLRAVAQAGARYAGFVFFEKSPRHVSVETARALALDAPSVAPGQRFALGGNAANMLMPYVGVSREMLEVDSLGFLSVEGLYWAMGAEERNADAPQFTDHCFTGDYPTPLIDRDREASGESKQLSFLVEVA